jgi:hypothetical protein
MPRDQADDAVDILMDQLRFKVDSAVMRARVEGMDLCIQEPRHVECGPHGYYHTIGVNIQQVEPGHEIPGWLYIPVQRLMLTSK